ncbi:MAG: PEGA domain-containing protein [Myxococcales bacterium]|nr:PEGA domain-containing protein [Myxococcales bacterium]
MRSRRRLDVALALAFALAATGSRPIAHAQSTPPVLVVVTAPAQAPAELTNDLRAALVEALSTHVRGRPVVALTDAERLATAARCSEDACHGAIVAQAGAVLGAFAFVARPGPRQPFAVRLELRDPVSGLVRGQPLHITLPSTDRAAISAALAAPVAALAPHLPRPPRPTTLLVAVNADDAVVTVDGREVGRSPLAPFEIEPGRRVVEVRRDGYLIQRRELTIQSGEDARLDVVLESAAAAEAPDATDDAEPPTGSPDRPRTSSGSRSEPPWYMRWYVLAAGAALLVGGGVLVVALATSGEDEPQGFRIPPIRPR